MAILAKLRVRRATAATIVLMFGTLSGTTAFAGSGDSGMFPFGFLFGPMAQPVQKQPAENPPAQRVACKAPSIYSPQLGRCVVPAKQAIICVYPLVKQGQVCVCAAAGYAWNAGKCVKSVVAKPPVVAKAVPVVPDKPEAPVPDKLPTIGVDVGHIQRCLAMLGYDPGATDGNIRPSTRAAFRTYQEENGLGGQPFNLSDQVTQSKLFQMCGEATRRSNEHSTTAQH
jgi:hypothetical protein